MRQDSCPTMLFRHGRAFASRRDKTLTKLSHLQSASQPITSCQVFHRDVVQGVNCTLHCLKGIHPSGQNPWVVSVGAGLSAHTHSYRQTDKQTAHGEQSAPTGQQTDRRTERLAD